MGAGRARLCVSDEHTACGWMVGGKALPSGVFYQNLSLRHIITRKFSYIACRWKPSRP